MYIKFLDYQFLPKCIYEIASSRHLLMQGQLDEHIQNLPWKTEKLCHGSSPVLESIKHHDSGKGSNQKVLVSHSLNR